MQKQQSEGKAEGVDDAPIVMRARGKSFGRLDPRTLQFSMKRGRVEVIFDLRATVQARRPVLAKKTVDE